MYLMDKAFLEKKKFSLSLLKNIKCFDTNKAAGVDTIPSKLIKIAADFLTLLLIASINKIIIKIIKILS